MNIYRIYFETPDYLVDYLDIRGESEDEATSYFNSMYDAPIVEVEYLGTL